MHQTPLRSALPEGKVPEGARLPSFVAVVPDVFSMQTATRVAPPHAYEVESHAPNAGRFR